jgi:PAS domain S-box-containing protein
MSGKIVAEDIVSPWQPCLNVQVQDTCFRENLGDAYCEGRIFAANDIYAANLTACHIKLLERFQVRANLVVPILLPNANKKSTLWGLLIIHQCSAPRVWLESDIQLLQQLSVQIAIAIKQAIAYQQIHIESVYLGCNQLFAHTTSLNSVQDIIGKTDLDFSNSEAQVLAYRADDLQVMESGIAKINFEEMVTKPSGKQIWVQTNKIPLRNTEGNVIGVMGAFQDISDRKQAELQLKKTSDRLALALSYGAIGYWECNIQQNYLIL